jgi:hypothetical protein
MIHTRLFHQVFTLKVQPSVEDYYEFSRILAAAVVSPRFCQSLLEEPETALRDGYMGESFLLSEAGWTWLQSIHANSLPELADRLVPMAGLSSQSPPIQLDRPQGYFDIDQYA